MDSQMENMFLRPFFLLHPLDKQAYISDLFYKLNIDYVLYIISQEPKILRKVKLIENQQLEI